MTLLPLLPSRRVAAVLFLGGVVSSVTTTILRAGEEPAGAAVSTEAEQGFVLTPDETKTAFDFDTGQIQGTIRLDGDLSRPLEPYRAFCSQFSDEPTQLSP